MTPEQKNLVRDSWEKVTPISDTAAQLFYGRLFETNPEFRPLFPADMAEQRHKLMQMIGLAVNGLDHLDEIIPGVQALGRRHAGYGVHEQDYAPVGTALLWTLEHGLGLAFTPDVKAAWEAVYTALATTMTEAARAG